MKSILKYRVLVLARDYFSLVRLVIQIEAILNVDIFAEVRRETYSSGNHNCKV